MTSTEFTPFDDSRQIVYFSTNTDTGGSDTSEIDAYRQGVEIRTNRHRFYSTQPKIWAGDINHHINVTTIGQARSFTEYKNSLLYQDLPEFDPVAYIVLGLNYPLPIIFNEGPQQEEETSLEPITIPFRKKTTEGPYYAHRVAGSVEDGNNLDTIFKNTNRTSQFFDYDDPLEQSLFLDEGQNFFGDGTLENKIIIDGYSYARERLLRPFDDTAMSSIAKSTKASSDLLAILLKMNINLNQDLRPYKTRSAGANTFVYGRDSAIYGTDSIAYLGLTRGS